jgi:hypothetical protein
MVLSPQVSNQVPVPLYEFTVMQNTDVIRLENSIISESIEERSHQTVFDGFESNFIKNFNQLGFVVIATHGTPTIVRVPCADTLPVENVPTWKGTRNETILLKTNRAFRGVDVAHIQYTCTWETTTTRTSSFGTQTRCRTPVAHYTKMSQSL